MTAPELKHPMSCREIEKQTGISKATISRFLNSGHDISLSTAQKLLPVLKACPCCNHPYASREGIAMAIGFASRHKFDASKDAAEFWEYLSSDGRRWYLRMADAVLEIQPIPTPDTDVMQELADLGQEYDAAQIAKYDDARIMEVTERVLHDMGEPRPAMSKLHHRQFLKAALRALTEGQS